MIGVSYNSQQPEGDVEENEYSNEGDGRSKTGKQEDEGDKGPGNKVQTQCAVKHGRIVIRSEHFKLWNVESCRKQWARHFVFNDEVYLPAKESQKPP